MKAVKFLSSVLAVTFLLAASLQDAQAQSREDVVNKFNEGFVLFNEGGNNLGAIQKFKETIELADQVGEDAQDIKERAIAQIPRLAFMHAAQFVRDRNLEDAIDAFEETIRLAEKYGDQQILSRARGNMPALYLNLGNQFYRDEDNQRAYELYQQALALNPSYVSAYYQLGLVYRRFGDLDKSLENFDITIDLARQTNDTENLERAQRQARDYLVFRASEQIEQERFARALDFLNRAAGYGESASLHYRFAETYNFMGRYNEALESARKALEMETGGRTDRARIYFELGLAYKGLDNTASACSAFRNALVGEFRAPAEHQIEHELNCN